jgi:hypothetical protein
MPVEEIMQIIRILPMLVVASLSPGAVLAASAPPQLYGKSLRLTWSTTRTFSEMGATRTRISDTSMRVYIRVRTHKMVGMISGL